MGNLHRLIARVGPRQPPSDLLRRPLDLRCSSTCSRSGPFAASLAIFGRRARSQHAASAAAARYTTRPPFRAISRETVLELRPIAAAIQRADCPSARPRETSSRSMTDRHRAARRRSTGRLPPQAATYRFTRCGGCPSTLASARSDNPDPRNTHTRSCSATDSPNCCTAHPQLTAAQRATKRWWCNDQMNPPFL